VATIARRGKWRMRIRGEPKPNGWAMPKPSIGRNRELRGVSRSDSDHSFGDWLTCGQPRDDSGMPQATHEVDWNDLRLGDIQVARDGRTRTVTDVQPVPGGPNWVTFDHGKAVGDGGRVTIRNRA
jgi:hypothetical protein